MTIGVAAHHICGMGAVIMGVAANEVNGGNKGWGLLQMRLAGAMMDGGGCKGGWQGR